MPLKEVGEHVAETTRGDEPAAHTGRGKNRKRPAGNVTDLHRSLDATVSSTNHGAHHQYSGAAGLGTPYNKLTKDEQRRTHLRMLAQTIMDPQEIWQAVEIMQVQARTS